MGYAERMVKRDFIQYLLENMKGKSTRSIGVDRCEDTERQTDRRSGVLGIPTAWVVTSGWPLLTRNEPSGEKFLDHVTDSLFCK